MSIRHVKNKIGQPPKDDFVHPTHIENELRTLGTNQKLICQCVYDGGLVRHDFCTRLRADIVAMVACTRTSAATTCTRTGKYTSPATQSRS